MKTLALFDDENLRPVAPARISPIHVTIEGRRLTTSQVFDTYWRFAAERQNVYFRRLEGESGPWTEDPILRRHRFTNAYRASDRVSQFLIKNVLYDGLDRSWDDQVFRVLLFKFFNKIETWKSLVQAIGDVSLDSFDYEAYAANLDELRKGGERLYSAAYVVPPPQFGEPTKHRNHLRLLEMTMLTDLPKKLKAAGEMSAAYEVLRGYPSVGKFLGFQFLIDLNYGTGMDYSEMDFVVAGPGACDGVAKCFGGAASGIEDSVIAWMARTQDDHFQRLGLDFRSLFGRPLQLVDVQNLFCEVDKYARVAHPDVAGLSGRTRIKQNFKPSTRPAQPFFPPKWNLSATFSRSSHVVRDERPSRQGSRLGEVHDRARVQVASYDSSAVLSERPEHFVALQDG